MGSSLVAADREGIDACLATDTPNSPLPSITPN